jgi:acetylornithine deacetylase
MDIERLLAELISIDSSNPDLGDGAGESEIAGFVAQWFRDNGVDAIIHDTGIEQRPNVIGRVSGGDGPTLMLNGHLDTVGVGGHIKPFTPRVEGRRMYGRGSMDTKGGLAALMIATARAAAEGVNGAVLFTGVADEEFASFGTEAIARDFSADAAIVTEPSQLGVTVAHKGFEWFEVEVTGFAAHGSMPDIGIDAITKMGKVLVAIEELGARLASGPSHTLLGSGSIHASLITGGQEASSYPRSSILTVERRTIPGETTLGTTEELRSILDTIAAGDPDFNAVLRHTMSRRPYEIAADHPFVELTCTAAEEVLGHPPDIAGHSGWMDTAILGAAGIPSVVLGPIGDGLHGDIEWVDLDSVHQMADIVTGIIRRFCG